MEGITGVSMSENYTPPFTMTEEITNLVIEIGELVGAVATYDTLQPNPKLRRESRIRSIHSSLAIEQNTLSLDQVTDVIDGKTVLGPPQDIREVKKDFFAWMPIETLIYVKQEGYYEALNASNTDGESTIFVTFMLEVIRDALNDVVNSQNRKHDVGANVGVNVGTNEDKVIMLLKQDSNLTAKTIAATLGLTDRQVERILSKLKNEGKLVRHGASKNGYWEVL
jgi:Fic family protein